MKIKAVVIFVVLFLPFFARANWLEDQIKNFANLNQERHIDNKNDISYPDAVAGLKDVLIISVNYVVNKLGRTDGFYKDPKVHIYLPKKLEDLRKFLRMVGLENDLGKLEIQMNRAAEKATPKTRAILLDAIDEMSIKDAKKIINGPDNAATEYFRKKMGSQLRDSIRPIIKRTLYKVGAIRTYQEIFNSIGKILPFVKSRGFSFIDYVTNKTLDGIFYYMAQEEKQIRENPKKRTTEMLKKIF